MVPTVNEFPIDRMTTDEQLSLLSRLWDHLLESNSLPPMANWHERLLVERLQDADDNPEASVSFDELRRELLGDAP